MSWLYLCKAPDPRGENHVRKKSSLVCPYGANSFHGFKKWVGNLTQILIGCALHLLMCLIIVRGGNDVSVECYDK